MTPQKQLLNHKPPESYGDCHRAALASILDLPILDVPHFMHGLGPKEGNEFERRQKEFLLYLGLVPICVPFDGSAGLDAVLQTLGAQCPGIYYLIGGDAGRGVGHTVVGCGGEIVHDPHPANIGIIGPMDDGLFWVTFIGSSVAYRPHISGLDKDKYNGE